MKNWFRHGRELMRSLLRLRPYLRGGRYLVAAVTATSLGAGLMEGVGVGLLVPLLSLLLGGEEARPLRTVRWLKALLPGHGPTYYVVVFCVLILVAIAAKNLVLYAGQVLSARLRRRIAANLRVSLFERLLGAELQAFERHTAGELANVFVGETNRTISFVDYLLLFSQRACICLFSLMMLLVLSAPLTFITIGLAAGMGLLIRFVYRRLAHSGQDIVILNQRVSSVVLEAFAGIRVVRSTHSQQRELNRFRDLDDTRLGVEEKATLNVQLIHPITETVAVAGAMAIIGCAYVLLVRTFIIPSSYLLGFGFVLLRLLPLVNQLYNVQSHLVYLAGGLREVEKWLDSPQHPGRPFGQLEFGKLSDGIRFENLTYVYPNGTKALTDISFEIPAGKTVALVGPSGSGKTTLAALLLRFREPTSGRILVDGQNYWDYSPASWHHALGVVEQEAFLFHDTLAENIGYGFPSVKQEAVDAAVAVANLSDVVASLPEGLKTIVGERGTLLSGGQRQRLAIARAVVRDPNILILDEATSSLDSLSERQVQVALEQAMRGRTVLVIAHRLSTVRRADRVVVLEQGRVAQQGTWDELVSRPGVFSDMVNSSDLGPGREAETDRAP